MKKRQRPSIYFVPGLFGWVEKDYTKQDGELPHHPRTGWEHPRPWRWYWLKSRALKRERWRCCTCNSRWNLQLHHRTYDRWGWERLSDVYILCRACHEKFHDIRRAA